MLRFNAEGPGGLVDRKAPGQPSRLDDAHRAALAAAVEDGPTSAIHGVVRWRLVDLCQWLWEELRVSVSKQTLSRELRAMGYRKLSARPRHHAQAAGAVERFKNLPRRAGGSRARGGRRARRDRGLVRRRGQDRAEEQDHPPLGPTRQPARRALRPARTASAYVFGAVCPWEGKGAALVLPRCDTEAMNLHLAEIAAAVAPGVHAVLLLDRAGWHMSDRLAVPPNVTLLPLPPKCPELNAMENVWQFMRDNWLSNRVLRSYEAIVENCCEAWNRLVDQPWRIMSLGLRDWAHGS